MCGCYGCSLSLSPGNARRWSTHHVLPFGPLVHHGGAALATAIRRRPRCTHKSAKIKLSSRQDLYSTVFARRLIIMSLWFCVFFVRFEKRAGVSSPLVWPAGMATLLVLVVICGAVLTEKCEQEMRATEYMYYKSFRQKDSVVVICDSRHTSNTVAARGLDCCCTGTAVGVWWCLTPCHILTQCCSCDAQFISLAAKSLFAAILQSR